MDAREVAIEIDQMCGGSHEIHGEMGKSERVWRGMYQDIFLAVVTDAITSYADERTKELQALKEE